MAVNGSNEGKPYIHGIVDGSCSLPVGCSSFKLLKPTIDEAPDVYRISMLPEEGNSLQCASVLGLLNFLKVSNPSKSQMSMDAQLRSQNCIDLQANRAGSHSPCIIEIDLEKGYIQAPESEEETVESLKREGILARVFQRPASLKIGGKLMQLLFNHGVSRDNPVIEKIQEAPNNRWRRCKRTATFDSRKVVFLFSVLSSLGTLTLIYLTLRVRQSADGFVHV